LIVKTINAQKMAQTTQEMYMGISAALIAVIFLITLLIVLFILYIVIRSLLVRRKQELGIMKAMGYTSGQLMLQTAGSFLPVTIVAVLLSSALGMVYMPFINQIIFSSVGAVRNNLEVSFAFLMIFAAVLIALNFIISICLTLPIRKISAYALIKE
ncbi:MAG: FtsX-like permease family protein, partial [Clostridia bacterium]|nr:FtsX-like permease family protein [Clostridia bacterium]